MYKSTAALSDPWRNFIPEAPDLRLQVIAGQPTFISLDNILVQGSVDLSAFNDEVVDYSISPLPLVTNPEPPQEPQPIKGRYTLDKKPAQRGWQLTYDVLNSRTKYGTVEKDQHKGGLVFTSKDSVTATDCINYFLSNGTQRSQLGTITLDIIRGHDLDFEFEYDADLNRYFIKTTKYKPAELGFYWYRIAWYTEGPYAEFNQYTKRDEIVRGRRLFLRTLWRIPPGSMSGNYVYTQLANSAYVTPQTDAGLAGIYDPKTNKPYIPLNKVDNLVLTYEVWPNHSGFRNYPAWTPVYYSEIDLNARLGVPWQEYGKREVE